MSVEDENPGQTPRVLRILGLGNSPLLGRELAHAAEHHGVSFALADDAQSAEPLLAAGGWDALLVECGDQSEEVLVALRQRAKALSPCPRILALVSTNSIALTMRAAQLGGIDLVPQSGCREQLLAAIHRLSNAAGEAAWPLPDVKPVAIGPHQLVSASAAMMNVYHTIAQVASSTATVLILGESGTGKELVARAIHQHSPRSSAPFVAVNCAAIPENLLESELFGHEKGAFTGAIARRTGRMERATGGTLLLDEVADMSLVLQSKILRAVQEREIERVGGTEPIPVDVRLIAATNRDLATLMSQGRFREDLYFRIAVVTIRVPTLVERGDDVLALTSFFLNEFGRQCGKPFTSISDRALALLRAQKWSGNVRELRNVIERAVAVADGGMLREDHLPAEWRASTGTSSSSKASGLPSLRDVEARHIADVLAFAQGHIGAAARILGLHRNTLARKMKEYGI